MPSMVLSVLREPLSPRCNPAFERSGLAREDLPLRQGSGASCLVGLAVDEMTFEVEVVVDVGVDGSELL